jgi:hypothetical protein
VAGLETSLTISDEVNAGAEKNGGGRRADLVMAVSK